MSFLKVSLLPTTTILPIFLLSSIPILHCHPPFLLYPTRLSRGHLFEVLKRPSPSPPGLCCPTVRKLTSSWLRSFPPPPITTYALTVSPFPGHVNRLKVSYSIKQSKSFLLYDHACSASGLSKFGFLQTDSMLNVTLHSSPCFLCPFLTVPFQESSVRAFVFHSSI